MAKEYELSPKVMFKVYTALLNAANVLQISRCCHSDRRFLEEAVKKGSEDPAGALSGFYLRAFEVYAMFLVSCLTYLSGLRKAVRSLEYNPIFSSRTGSCGCATTAHGYWRRLPQLAKTLSLSSVDQRVANSI